MNSYTFSATELTTIKNFLEQLSGRFINLFGSATRYSLENNKDITLVFSKELPASINFELTFKDGGFKVQGSVLDIKSIQKLNVLLDDYLPFPDVSTLVTDQEAFDLMKKHGQSLPIRIESPQGCAYVISKETYDYFASKCLKHETYDAHVLGASENFVKASPVKITLKPKI